MKLGMDNRKINGNLHGASNEAASFDFQPGALGRSRFTAAVRLPTFCSAPSTTQTRRSGRSIRPIPRQHRGWIVHAGDTWRVNDKLTVDYGLRWDYFSPSSAALDCFSFFRRGWREPLRKPAVVPVGSHLPETALERQAFTPAIRSRRTAGMCCAWASVDSWNDKTVVRGGWRVAPRRRSIRSAPGIAQDGFSNSPVPERCRWS